MKEGYFTSGVVVGDSLGLTENKDFLLPTTLGLEVPWKDFNSSLEGNDTLVGILGNIFAIRSTIDNVVVAVALVVVAVVVVVASVVAEVVVSEVVVEMVVAD